MIDIEIDRGVLATRDLMVVEARGKTEAGVEFIDAYYAEGEFVVADAGRIVIHETEAATLISKATDAGLSTEVVG